MNSFRLRLTRAARTLYRGTARFFSAFVYSMLISLLYIIAPAPKIIPWSVYTPLEYGIWAALFASVPAHLLSECRDTPRPAARFAVIGFTALMGVLWGTLYYAVSVDAFKPWSAYCSMAYTGFMLLCVVVSYLLLMNAQNEYTLFPTVAGAFLYALSASLILFLLLAGCMSAYEALLGTMPEVVIRAALCLLFFVLSINLFLANVPRRRTTLSLSNRLWDVCVSVLTAVFLILLAILFVYVGKIIVTRTMPVGVMNWYASLALLSYLALWMAGASKRDSVVCRFYARFSGFALLPVIAVQIYGIAVRFNAYGLTEARYTSMVCLALGVFALALTLLRRSLRPAFIAATAALIALTVTPLNMIDVPVMEQEARLRDLLSENGMLDGDTMIAATDLSVEARSDIRSCILYLEAAPSVRRSAFWQKNLSDPYPYQTFDRIGLETSGATVTVRHTYRNDALTAVMPVSGYSWAKSYDDVEYYKSSEFTLRVNVPDQEERLYSLRESIDAFVDAHADDTASDIDIRFELDGRATLLLKSLSVRYDDGVLGWCRFSGLLLIKE